MEDTSRIQTSRIVQADKLKVEGQALWDLLLCLNPDYSGVWVDLDARQLWISAGSAAGHLRWPQRDSWWHLDFNYATHRDTTLRHNDQIVFRSDAVRHGRSHRNGLTSNLTGRRCEKHLRLANIDHITLKSRLDGHDSRRLS